MREIPVYRQTRKRDKRYTVVVAVNMPYAASQRKLAGIFAHLGSDPDWDIKLFRTREDIESPAFRQLLGSEIDGIIYSAPYSAETFQYLKRARCPLVVIEHDVSELARRKSDLMFIRSDAEDIVRTGIRLFQDIGPFREYAFVNDRDGMPWSREREAAFRRLAPRDVPHRIYPSSHLTELKDRQPLARFLSSLTYPAAIIAVHDTRATEIIAAAKKAKIDLPGKLSLIGIDNDPYVCDSCTPSLTSIEPDCFAEGKAAAELLDMMMRGRQRKSTRHVTFGAKCIVIRESTRHLPPAGKLIDRAKAFIEANALEGISPADVAAHLGVSRALLYLRFKESEGCTVAQLITQRKLREVARLLTDTKTSISAITHLCGFANENSLKNLFVRHFGASMREYRKANISSGLKVPGTSGKI